MWMGVDDGAPVAGYEHTEDRGFFTSAGGNFQKGGGLGGISLLAEAAPVEIGNRVWFDADSDGIQDPSEPSLAGVTVELIRNGVVVGTTTTDANGEYYFSSDPDSEFYDADLEPDGGDYTVRFVKPTTGNVFVDDPVYGTLGWDRADFTIAEATTSEIGSNPDPTTGEFTFTVGGPGENNHEIDAGFFPDVEPEVDIEKGDGSGTTIDHDADTMPVGESYTPGEQRTIVFRVTNTGTEELREIVLTDETLSGGDVEQLVWSFPDGTTATAADVAGVLTARWEATFDPGTEGWDPGAVIIGTAVLSVDAADEPHVDGATVDAVGRLSGIAVSDEDDYNAFTGAIQVIKYDADSADPVVSSGGTWVTPAKPLVDPAQDANTRETAVGIEAETPHLVRWVVTNTGSTWLTDIDLVDTTNLGAAIRDDWTADLSAFGGPVDYSFVDDGPWAGPLPPGASFFAEGTLVIAQDVVHTDTVSVTAQVIVPEVDGAGLPTGDPSRDANGDPIGALRNGQPFLVSDSDPYNAIDARLLALTGSATASLGAALALLTLGLALLAMHRLLRRSTPTALVLRTSDL